MNIVEAAGEGNIERIKTLLDEGVDINFKNENGIFPLYTASQSSDGRSSLETVKFLIDKGADVNLKTERLQATPLMTVAQFTNSTSSIDTLKLLLDAGADINAKNINGVNAVFVAAKNSDGTSSLEAVKFLINEGADLFVKTLNTGIDIIEVCPSDECKKLILPYIWKRLYQRDVNTALRYSRQSIFPKDVWEIILLNKRQQLLCSKLSSNNNREVLRLFAMELNIPITDEMTKAQLCGLVSRQIAYGKLYHKTEEEMDRIKKQMISIAKKFGINTNRTIQEIMADITKVLI